MAYQLNYAELAGLWIEAGGPGGQAGVAAAIAMAESRGCQYALAGPVDIRPEKVCAWTRTSGENSCGFWQINLYAHPNYSAPTIFEQLVNARAAVAISNNGSDFGAWTTYVDGAYTQYLQADFVPTIPSGGGTVSATGALSGAAPATSTHQVDQAWTRLMRTLAITAPQHLATVAAARTRIRNSVR